jgi:hypothetical protein
MAGRLILVSCGAPVWYVQRVQLHRQRVRLRTTLGIRKDILGALKVLPIDTESTQAWLIRTGDIFRVTPHRGSFAVDGSLRSPGVVFGLPNQWMELRRSRLFFHPVRRAPDEPRLGFIDRYMEWNAGLGSFKMVIGRAVLRFPERHTRFGRKSAHSRANRHLHSYSPIWISARALAAVRNLHQIHAGL